MRFCGYCGANLGLSAVQAERRVKLLLELAPEDLPGGIPITPEILLPRLGDYLLEKEVLTRQELQQALEYQQKQTSAGRPMLLGQALRELGLVDPESLDQVITVQILQLQKALRQSNRQLEQRVQERTQELQQAVNQLTELGQLKANFIANISHELRTPLTHIKGYLDLLAERGLGPLTAQQQEGIEVLRRAEARLERLIEDLIQFSLAARGELNLNITQVDLETLAHSARSEVLHKAREKEVAVDLKLPERLPGVHCDGEKILWVLIHLLDNGVKFTPRGGRVVLAASRKDSQVHVSVVDTGIGIPPSRYEEIFQPFHQLDSSSTRRYAGTGLGLALSSRILEAHGSKIGVQSVEGRGTRFHFSLPVVTQKAGTVKGQDV